MLEPLGFILLLVAAQVEATVTPLTGETMQGQIVQLDNTGATLTIGGEDRTFKSEEFRRVEFQRADSAAKQQPSIQIELTDGSVVRAEQYTVADTTATLTIGDGLTVTAPTSAIRRVLLQDPGNDAAAQQQWEKLSTEELGKDILVFRRAESLDSFDGVLGEITAQQVEFTYGDSEIPANRERVIGFTYFHPNMTKDSDPVVCNVVDENGSNWRAASVELKDGELHWTTPSKVSLHLPVSRVHQLDYAAGNLVYLSDLKPEVETWEPYIASRVARELLASRYAPRRDQSLEGGPMRLGGNEFSKGLALHSRTEMVFRLTEPYRRFRAVVGLDDRVRDAEIAASVRLVITGDDRVLFDQVISATDTPLDLDLDITGIRRLRILADFGEDLDVADYLNLCEARLTK